MEIVEYIFYLHDNMKAAISKGKRSFRLNLEEDSDSPNSSLDFYFSKRYQSIFLKFVTEHFLQSVCNEPLQCRKKHIDPLSPIPSREVTRSGDNEVREAGQGNEIFALMCGGQETLKNGSVKKRQPTRNH